MLVFPQLSYTPAIWNECLTFDVGMDEQKQTSRFLIDLAESLDYLLSQLRDNKLLEEDRRRVIPHIARGCNYLAKRVESSNFSAAEMDYFRTVLWLCLREAYHFRVSNSISDN